MNAPDWFLLIVTLPTRQSALRMRLWRTLNAMGCAMLRDGVYLAPARGVERQPLETLVQEVGHAEGSGFLFTVSGGDPAAEAALAGLFDRTPLYEAFLGQVREVQKALAPQNATQDGKALTALRRQLAEIVRIDFFPGSGQSAAQAALAAVTARLQRLHQPGEPLAGAGEIPLCRREEFQGRLWVTRSRPWVDRLASGWLIRRFIDSQARLLFLDDPALAPQGAVGFDHDTARFSHVGDKVTFQTLLAAFALAGDPGLARLGLLVGQMDGGLGQLPEEQGVEAMLRGAQSRCPDDHALFDQSCFLWDNLYAAYVAAHSS